MLKPDLYLVLWWCVGGRGKRGVARRAQLKRITACSSSFHALCVTFPAF